MRQRFRECPDLFLQRAALDRDVDVNSARARGFCIAGDFQGIERITNNERGFEDPFELRAFDGIEIELQKIGTVDVVAARVPGIQVDAPEIHYPHQRRHVLNDWKLDYVSGSVFNGADGNRRGAGGRRALHEEKSAIDAVGIALHDHGAVDQMRHQVRGDVEIVLEQVAFGKAKLRPEYFVEIGQLRAAAFDFDFRVVHARRNSSWLNFRRSACDFPSGFADGGFEGAFFHHELSSARVPEAIYSAIEP